LSFRAQNALLRLKGTDANLDVGFATGSVVSIPLMRE
jgi:hypothetical protein